MYIFVCVYVHVCVRARVCVDVCECVVPVATNATNWLGDLFYIKLTLVYYLDFPFLSKC